MKEPWTVSSLALRVGEVLYDDHDYGDRTRALVAEQRAILTQELGETRGLDPIPSAANFLLLRIKRKGLTSGELRQRMMRQRMLIRDCANFRGLDGSYVRIAVRPEPENRRLLQAFQSALAEGA